jgi:hypothetical protein
MILALASSQPYYWTFGCAVINVSTRYEWTLHFLEDLVIQFGDNEGFRMQNMSHSIAPIEMFRRFPHALLTGRGIHIPGFREACPVFAGQFLFKLLLVTQRALSAVPRDSGSC